jgi:O-antigen ligase
MRRLRSALLPLFLLACLLLGGSPQGIWRNLVLQLFAAGLLAYALLTRRPASPTRAGRLLLALSLAWFGLVLLQLLPLPPALWTLLPGRELAAEGYALRGEPLPWLPLSLTPAATASTLPVMLVPFAILAGMLLLGAYRSRWCIAALLAGVLVSVLLAALQVSSGGPYLYPIHNSGGTGLFANSNHQGTLLLVSIPFIAVLVGREQGRPRGRAKERISRLVIAVGGFTVVAIGIALNGSLAALLLFPPVALASLAIALPGRPGLGRAIGGGTLLLLLGGAAALALASDAGTADTSFTSRADIYQRTGEAISATFPAGTGLGSFETVYPAYEDPATVDRWFVNNAHNDLLEWLLETGLPGGLLLLVFLLWWARRSWWLWSGAPEDLLARAGTIATAAILAHSLVDYPLRDAAIQALFALGLAFMVDPRSHRVRPVPAAERAPRHLALEDA